MAQQQPAYPVQFSVEYPDKDLDRLSSFFRWIAVIPIAIVLPLVSFGGFLFAPLLMIVFRNKYPRWWFDWDLAVLRFFNRVSVYSYLLRDEYPSTDDEQYVHLEIPYPDVERDLNRWLPLVKWFLAIPHYIVLIVLSVVSTILVAIMWFSILFTGRIPRPMFDFVVGTMRWFNRVTAYAFLLATDQYPPFRLSP